MAKVEVKLLRWVADHEAAEGEEHSILLAKVVSIDGDELAGMGDLVCDGFVTVEVKDPSPELLARYSAPEAHLQGTGDDLLVLSVTELVIVDA